MTCVMFYRFQYSLFILNIDVLALICCWKFWSILYTSCICRGYLCFWKSCLVWSCWRSILWHLPGILLHAYLQLNFDLLMLAYSFPMLLKPPGHVLVCYNSSNLTSCPDVVPFTWSTLLVGLSSLFSNRIF